jgi:LEA14-like dessication related protein
MFFTRRRIILIFAVAAVAGTIIILPYISSLTATRLDRVTIELLDVEPVPVSQEQNNGQMDVVFRLTNPTDKTVTTSKIEYDLIADNTELGNSILSYEDVPPNGRPTILPNRSINLTSLFQLPTSQPTQIIFGKLANSSSDIDWKVEGVARIESAVTLHEKPFTDEL